VLQEREITRVGESIPRAVNVRIIASTNRPLKQMVDQGLFRADLYFRLKVLEIAIPPLRERSEDILGLVGLFIKRFSGIFGKPVYDIAPEAIQALVSYQWPGNVRELQNCFEYVFNILDASSHSISMNHLPAGIAAKNDRNNIPCSLYDEMMQQTELEIISQAMQQCRGNKTEAAKRLGINRTTLWRILKKHNLLGKYESATVAEMNGVAGTNREKKLL
jgi:transcriptional regulator with PAS, ATPase and Fis domain